MRRERVAKLAALGRRVGYTAFALAVAGFVIGFAAGFNTALVAFEVVCLTGGSIVLAPAIVAGYGVKAAEREDREQSA